MAPSSYQRYFNTTSTLFQHYFYTFKVKNDRGTSGKQEKNDGSPLYPTVGELRGETCQVLVFLRGPMIDLGWQNPIWL